MHACIPTSRQTYIHPCIHTYTIHTCLHACMLMHSYAHKHTHTRARALSLSLSLTTRKRWKLGASTRNSDSNDASLLTARCPDPSARSTNCGIPGTDRDTHRVGKSSDSCTGRAHCPTPTPLEPIGVPCATTPRWAPGCMVGSARAWVPDIM